MDKTDRTKKIVDELVENAKRLTIESGMNSEEEIRSLIQGEIDYEYKTRSDVPPEMRKRLAEAISSAVIALRFGKKDEPETVMKIYIARDRAVFEDEQQERFIHRHPEKENQYGRLRLFYEKPKLNHETGIWEQARGAAEIKNYMFPQIRCEECAEFEGPGKAPENQHYPGSCFKVRKPCSLLDC